MTIPEFSTEFDVLYNNITSNQAPGLNEYEKSVFLTKAQSQLINEYFNNRADGLGGGFDGSQKRQYDFSSLIQVVQLQEHTEASYIKLDKRSKVFLFPKDYFLAVNEIISDGIYQYSVAPISYAEYQRLMLKPYNFPVKRGVWRLNTNIYVVGEDSQPIVEIIGKFQKTQEGTETPTEKVSYNLRYIKTPSPIILDDLSNYGQDLTIGGLPNETPCKLPEETHQEILERAVTLAKIAWQGGTGTLTQAAAQQRNNN